MPGYGYREAKPERRHREDDSSESSRAAKKRAKADRGDRGDRPERKVKKVKRRRRDQDGQLMDEPPAKTPAQAPAAAPAPDKKNWRAEIHETEKVEEVEDDHDDGYVPPETDEDVDKKLAESRARREALIAKWVTRGEDGPLETPATNESLKEEDEESDGEVAAFFAAQAKKQEDDGPVDAAELEKKKAINRFILQHRGEHDGDMFDEDTDANAALNKKVDQTAAIGQTGASGDDWNDAEGYYKAKVGELMDDRYLITEDLCGKGVFSTVIKAKDKQKNNEMVAIKLMRANDMMESAAEKEIDVLIRINNADKGNKKNVIRLLRQFKYRGHLCLVFECMWDNLRVAMKKYTKDKGMSLRAVRAYTKQLLVALQHIHRCGVIHADLKPDNILISAGHNVTKICDLGSAIELTEIEPTPYLVSRFYRAPEIVLGAKYGPPSDTFAMGATLCEIFTGKILFPGKCNNDMLRCFMEYKGKPTKSLIKSGMCWEQHFDKNLDFLHVATDKLTRKRKVRCVTDCSAKTSLMELMMTRVGAEKQKSADSEDQLYVKKAKQFADLIGHMTTLDPEKRFTPEQCLKHPFVVENMPAPAKQPAPVANAKTLGAAK